MTRTFVSEEEYLERERKALFKSEYYKGDVFVMDGAKRKHNAIVTALIASLYPFLKDRPCEVYPSDMRVGNKLDRFYTYPDVSIVCGKPEFVKESHGETFSLQSLDVLLNLNIIYEKVEFPIKRLREDYR